jgi:hypothetical protein
VNAIDRLCTIATDVSLEATTLAADVRDELANMRSAIGKALADMKDVDEPCDGGSWCSVHEDHVPIDSEHCHTHQGHLRLQALLPEAPMSARTTSDHIDGLTGEVVAQMDRADAITAAARALLDELGDDRCLLGFVPQASGKYCSPHGKFGVTHARCSTGQAIDALRAALTSSALPSPPVERVQAPAGEASGDAPPQAGHCGAVEHSEEHGEFHTCRLYAGHLGPHVGQGEMAFNHHIARSATTTER